MATRKITKTVEAPVASTDTEVKKPRRAAAPKAEMAEAAPKRARKPKAEVEVAKPEVVAEMVPAQASVMHHEERLRHISEAAYYLAERRGFAPGFEHDDWVQAESDVSEKLKG
jgi:hypothetical protein